MLNRHLVVKNTFLQEKEELTGHECITLVRGVSAPPGSCTIDYENGGSAIRIGAQGHSTNDEGDTKFPSDLTDASAFADLTFDQTELGRIVTGEFWEPSDFACNRLEGTPEQPPQEYIHEAENQPNFFTQPVPRGTCVTWIIEARKLKSSDRQIVSPLFHLYGSTSALKLLLFPIASSEGRGGNSFKQSKGKVCVHVKFEGAPLIPEGTDPQCHLSLLFSVGGLDFRGPVSNDFTKRPVCGLPQNVATWDVSHLLEEQGDVQVVLEVSMEPRNV